MKFIYVVTTGEYDDYRIIGVYDNKEKAEPVAKGFFDKGEQGYVEEYPINQIGSVYRRSANQIRSKRYIPVGYYEDQEYISDYLTGDEHFDIYMERLGEQLERQEKQAKPEGGASVSTQECFSTQMPDK